MAHDDMHVVVCKVMDYVIRCNKAGRAVRPGDIGPDALGLTMEWWTTCMLQMADNGLVDGMRTCSGESGRLVADTSGLTVTLKGSEYFEENRALRRAYKKLSEARALLPL